MILGKASIKYRTEFDKFEAAADIYYPEFLRTDIVFMCSHEEELRLNLSRQLGRPTKHNIDRKIIIRERRKSLINRPPYVCS